MKVKELAEILEKANPEDEIKYAVFSEPGIVAGWARIDEVTTCCDEDGNVNGVGLL